MLFAAHPRKDQGPPVSSAGCGNRTELGVVGGQPLGLPEPRHMWPPLLALPPPPHIPYSDKAVQSVKVLGNPQPSECEWREAVCVLGVCVGGGGTTPELGW